MDVESDSIESVDSDNVIISDTNSSQYLSAKSLANFVYIYK
jgi:hypothetical protein